VPPSECRTGRASGASHPQIACLLQRLFARCAMIYFVEEVFTEPGSLALIESRSREHLASCGGMKTCRRQVW